MYPRKAAAPSDPFLCALSDLGPLAKIEGATKSAFSALKRGDNQETWTDKCEGLTIFRQLLSTPYAMDSEFNLIVDALLAEVLNLRSQVARVAMLALADFCTVLGKLMDPLMSKIITALFKKAAAEAG